MLLRRWFLLFRVCSLFSFFVLSLVCRVWSGFCFGSFHRQQSRTGISLRQTWKLTLKLLVWKPCWSLTNWIQSNILQVRSGPLRTKKNNSLQLCGFFFKKVCKISFRRSSDLLHLNETKHCGKLFIKHFKKRIK